MRDDFPAYYAPSEALIERLWSSALICPDASVLLDLFRLQDGAARETIRLFGKVAQVRRFVPHQCASEYHRGLDTVIATQAKECDDALRALMSAFEDFEKAVENERQYPHLSPQIMKPLSQAVAGVRDFVSAESGRLKKMITENPRKDEVAALFKGCVGPAPTDAELSEHLDAAGDRARKKIPPGYMDAKGGGTGGEGDYLSWVQMMAAAVEHKKGVIFVTQDVKEDWFKRVGGKTIGPRPELREEFSRKTSLDFYAYPLSRFLELAGKYFGETVERSTIDAARGMAEARRDVAYGDALRSPDTDTLWIARQLRAGRGALPAPAPDMSVDEALEDRQMALLGARRRS